MSNRMLELVVDADRVEGVERLLDEADVMDWWSTGHTASGAGDRRRACFHVLVESGGVESLMDRLEPLSEGEAGIRVLVTGIDATRATRAPARSICGWWCCPASSPQWA